MVHLDHGKSILAVGLLTDILCFPVLFQRSTRCLVWHDGIETYATYLRANPSLEHQGRISSFDRFSFRSSGVHSVLHCVARSAICTPCAMSRPRNMFICSGHTHAAVPYQDARRFSALVRPSFHGLPWLCLEFAAFNRSCSLEKMRASSRAGCCTRVQPGSSNNGDEQFRAHGCPVCRVGS